MSKIEGGNPDPDNYRDGTEAENLAFYSFNGNNSVRTMPGKGLARILSNSTF
jgi:hypothetical protein